MSSAERGATWSDIALPFKLGGNMNGRGTGERLAVDPHDGTRIFLGTTAATLSPHWISDVEIDPFNSGGASFVTGYGLFPTSNLGATPGQPAWSFDCQGLEECVPQALVSPAAGPPLVSVIGDFYGFRHDNLDASPALGRHSPPKGTTHALDGAGTAPAVLAKMHGATGSISRDGGVTWTDFPAAPPTASGERGELAVSADGARILWCPKASAAYVSPDDGATWTPVNLIIWEISPAQARSAAMGRIGYLAIQLPMRKPLFYLGLILTLCAPH